VNSKPPFSAKKMKPRRKERDGGWGKEINLEGITMAKQQRMYGLLLKVKIPNK
jgi:hypothetical protein